MANTTVVTVVPPLFDEAKLSVAGFLARYSGNQRELRLRSAAMVHLVREPFPTTSSARPGHLEVWARDMEEHGRATGHDRPTIVDSAGFLPVRGH